MLKAVVLVICISAIVKEQTSKTEFNFTDVFWAITSYDQINLANADTVSLVRLSTKDSLFIPPFRGGFIFKSDGTFEEYFAKFESSNRNGHSGNWHRSKDTIHVSISPNIRWQFLLIDVSETEFKTRILTKKL